MDPRWALGETVKYFDLERQEWCRCVVYGIKINSAGQDEYLVHCYGRDSQFDEWFPEDRLYNSDDTDIDQQIDYAFHSRVPSPFETNDDLETDDDQDMQFDEQPSNDEDVSNDDLSDWLSYKVYPSCEILKSNNNQTDSYFAMIFLRIRDS